MSSPLAAALLACLLWSASALPVAAADADQPTPATAPAVTAPAVTGDGAVVTGEPADAKGDTAAPAELGFCPIMPDERSELEYPVQHQGRTFYLCCKKCVRKFNADPAHYVAEWTAKGIAVPGATLIAATTTDPATTPSPPAKANDDRPPFLGRLHPAVLHFPIACLMLAVLAELMLIVRGPLAWSGAVRLLMVTGVLGAGFAVLSGTWLADDQPVDLLDRHRWLGWSTLVGASLALIAMIIADVRASSRWRWTFRVLLAVSIGLVSWTADVGGDMVYGRGWMW